MTKLIKTLLSDHRTILNLLQKVKNADLTIKEREAYLITVKSVLNNHLKLEDLKLYPKLKELATEENGAIKTVKEFTVGLDKIGEIIKSFFDQNGKDLENIHMSSDFAKIIKLLEVRILKEEKGLYPLYDKLVKD